MATSDDTASLPSRGELSSRLERQRARALSAFGICTLAAAFVGNAENNGEMVAEDLVALRVSLEGLSELLDSVKIAISPEEILSLPESVETAEEVQS